PNPNTPPSTTTPPPPPRAAGGAAPAGGPPATLTPGRLHGAAVVRIVFGLLWAADATFKWLPGFIHGQTLGDELGKAADVRTPVFHQWLQMWHAIGTSAPGTFAVGTAVVETLIALGLILGAFSNAVLIGSAVFSFGIWSGAEGFHLPWKQGMTDLGPSVGYIFASLALYYAFAGSTWSLDTRLRPTLGRYGWLCGRRAG
ncbi:hypothetical protein, partial [Streptomyces sp. 8L]|uniref:hypothetical protein n=1 Tax=Streptomyces sp. 8L TaxID=2877242 RepID=UPI001CD46757